MISLPRLSRLAAAFAVTGLGLPAVAQSSIAPAVQQASKALAHVSVLFEVRGSAVRVERPSSGFIVDARGLLLTNEHLVDEIPIGGGAPGEEYWLLVILGSGRPCGARLVARDERLDLALLQLELEPGELLDSIELAEGAPPAVGADAFALGRPRGGQHFALAGTAALPSGPVTLRDALLEPGEALITDAAVLEDVDGGPLVDRTGHVLGIVNTAQRTEIDLKAEDDVARDPLEYALAISAGAIRGAFGAQLGKGDAGARPVGSDDPTAASVRAAAPAVVSVWAGDEASRPERSGPKDPHAEDPGEGLGSGVIVDPAGLVLTSSDIVGAATDVHVRLLDGRAFRGEVVKSVPGTRVALVQLALPAGIQLPAIELGSSDAALAGEAITVIGNPYGHTPTVSAGVLSALERDGRLRVGAWVHDGHKGGALLDSTGRLIGLPAADIFEGEERKRGESYLGVAVPIDRVREALAAELSGEARPAGLRAAPVATDEQLVRRRDRVTAVVDATHNSLLNIEVHAEAPKATGFDPFATPGAMHMLGQGAGVVIDESGLAITNWHVVDATLAADGSQRADHKLEVTLPNGKRYVARVLATSRDDDLGLIQLELPDGEEVVPVPLGASRPMRRGDVVIAIGNPYGKANTVTVGIVAAKDQDAKISGRLHVYKNMLQTDAAINPGNSGGALLDSEGRLVGINSAGRAGAGLAIPVERVRDVFGQKLLATMGAFVGFAVDDGKDGAPAVSAVDEHGPAASAGVQKGDRLVAVDERPVRSTMEFGNALLGRGLEPMRVALERDGATVTVVLQPLHHAAWRLFRQTGLELVEVDYSSDSAQVGAASIALHRAYTGIDDGEPNQLMSGALRVVRVVPREGLTIDVQPGDLLLGATAVVRGVDTELERLVRFEGLHALRDFVEPLVTKAGAPAEFWLLRDGKVLTTSVSCFKVR